MDSPSPRYLGEAELPMCPSWRTTAKVRWKLGAYGEDIIWTLIWLCIYPRCSMYGIFTYIWAIFGVNVGKYSIHGAFGYIIYIILYIIYYILYIIYYILYIIYYILYIIYIIYYILYIIYYILYIIYIIYYIYISYIIYYILYIIYYILYIIYYIFFLLYTILHIYIYTYLQIYDYKCNCQVGGVTRSKVIVTRWAQKATPIFGKYNELAHIGIIHKLTTEEATLYGLDMNTHTHQFMYIYIHEDISILYDTI